jgi:hypothetical protein
MFWKQLQSSKNSAFQSFTRSPILLRNSIYYSAGAAAIASELTTELSINLSITGIELYRFEEIARYENKPAMY